MKSILFTILLALPLWALAQTQGTVTYKETIKLNIEFELPEGMDEALLAQIPNSQSATKVLYFNETESIFKDAPAEDEAEGTSWNGSSGGAEVRMVMRQPESSFYLNFEEERRIEQREFMGKVFRINGDMPSYEWKITSEQKTFEDYVLMQATFEDSTRKIVAWFCPQIPVSGGPDAFTQLPGLVLEVDINDGERTLVATEVSLGEPAEAIEKPKKGKEITQEEFEAVVAEKMKEMEAEYGGSSGDGEVRIMIRN
ncbi:MAG: GLPGLI family protein [Bacteroidota bacterium]